MMKLLILTIRLWIEELMFDIKLIMYDFNIIEPDDPMSALMQLWLYEKRYPPTSDAFGDELKPTLPFWARGNRYYDDDALDKSPLGYVLRNELECAWRRFRIKLTPEWYGKEVLMGLASLGYLVAVVIVIVV